MFGNTDIERAAKALAQELASSIGGGGTGSAGIKATASMQLERKLMEFAETIMKEVREEIAKNQPRFT